MLATDPNTTPQGLSTKEAKRRLLKYGENRIQRGKRVTALKILLSQFSSPLILILLGAALVSGLIGFLPNQAPNTADVVLIGIIVVLSGIFGFIQDYKAERAIESIQKMATPRAHVLRDGERVEIKATLIVPGDLIFVKAGDIIPADAKITRATSLSINEAPLTGESRAVHKGKGARIFMNTYVLSGEAWAIVQSTGRQSSVGKIAAKLEEVEEEKSGFEEETEKLVRKVSVLTLALIGLMMLVAIPRYGLYESLLSAISLAVAAIPEGLPAVIVLTLAIGAQTMSKKKALIRKMSVTEAIGAVDVICTDKTGTLTENDMQVNRLFMLGQETQIASFPLNLKKPVRNLVLAGALCNGVYQARQAGKETYVGNATEIALQELADKLGYTKTALLKDYQHIGEVPFTAERKLSSHLYLYQHKKRLIFTKGAPEVLIEKCNWVIKDARVVPLSTKLKGEVQDKVAEYAAKGLRVLAFAYKKTKQQQHPDNLENGLIFLGLQAMIDPPRVGVKKALAESQGAGIRVIMLTGDNPLTAQAIARQVALGTKGIVLGQEIDQISDEELERRLKQGVNIYARVSPFHKLRILRILKKHHRVAMTGDGVNDALALKKADVGIAMGIRGTEVAKQASDIILLDDNFASIVSAVKEGRRIFDNIQKFINYLFVSNLAEVIVVFVLTLAARFKTPVLLPVQLLWINLLTDGLPALALGVDPARPGIMKRPPRRMGKPILSKRLTWITIGVGLKKAFMLLFIFLLTLPWGLEIARTVLFTGFIIYELVRIGVIRHQERLTWLSNKWLLGSIIISLFLQLMIIYTPLNAYFAIAPLGFYPWLVLILGASLGYILAIMITKLVLSHVPEQ